MHADPEDVCQPLWLAVGYAITGTMIISTFCGPDCHAQLLHHIMHACVLETRQFAHARCTPYPWTEARTFLCRRSAARSARGSCWTSSARGWRVRRSPLLCHSLRLTPARSVQAKRGMKHAQIVLDEQRAALARARGRCYVNSMGLEPPALCRRSAA